MRRLKNSGSLLVRKRTRVPADFQPVTPVCPIPALSNAQARDLSALFHPYSNLALLAQTGSLIIERGQGVRVYDAAGKDYIEAMSGLWSTSLGWGRE